MEQKTLEEKREKTKLVLSNVYNLPAASNVMMEVTRLIDTPTTNTSLLSKIIGKDQGMATKILSIANSPLYGLPRKVSTIDFAILIIGYQDIKNIVVALTMIESFKNKDNDRMNQKEFWQHSIITGNAAKRIAEDLGYRIENEAFVAGLLHDLGLPVIHKYFHSNFDTIVQKFEGDTDYLTAEVEVLGYNHQEIGSMLAEKWNLPPSLCTALKYHHTPVDAPDHEELTSLIHLADYMTQKLQIGSFYLDEDYHFDDSIIEILRFANENEVDDFIDSYKDIFEEEKKTFKIEA